MAEVRVNLTADGGSVAAHRAEALAAEGRLQRTKTGWEVVATGADPVRFDHDAHIAVLTGLVEVADRAGGGEIRWLVTNPSPDHDQVARSAGLGERRDLLQMRRHLPLETALLDGVPSVATRPFRPGVDEAAWLETNNRSFADHPDQSRQTIDDLLALEAQIWFDPDGFLLLDAAKDGPRDGALDGFCWTKIHPAEPGGTDPPLGEIFVIGVDPAAQGRKLGPALTVAGLAYLTDRGITVAMLYVDEANPGAVRMYERLNFMTHHVDRIYSRSGSDS